MRYLILGATEARDDRGRPVPLGGHRLRALLAALALHADAEAAVPVDVLISEVWADASALPDDAPAALQALIGRLRRALGRDAVASLPGGYRLCADADDIDLYRFRRLAAQGEQALAEGDPHTAAAVLREALALWRGPALADLPDRTSAAARAEAVRATAHQTRITADLALGNTSQALPELRELAAAQPLDEPLHALLVRTLRDTGRTAEALAAYETVRGEISRRLGADPGAELPALHAELLAAGAGEPSPDERTRDTAEPQPARRTGRGAGAASRNGVPLQGGVSPGDGVTTQDPASTGAGAATGAGASTGAAPAGHVSGTAPGAAEPSRNGHGSQPPPEPPPGNLRARLTSFVGREADIDTLRADLHRSRLVTLTGPGGSGKTRLSEQAATAVAGSVNGGVNGGNGSGVGNGSGSGSGLGNGSSAGGLPSKRGPAPAGPPYPDGVWMAELAPLDHPAAVPGAVLSALGRRGTSLFTGTIDTAAARTQLTEHDHDATARLLEHCANRRLLLVLDNCEHVIDAAAHLAETLLAHCPGLTVLATSREPLGVPGEAVRPVEPLPPDSALRLFADRAESAMPGFRVDDDRASVTEICSRLDGLPLAIELAAARLRSLTPRQIACRLDDRFRLLTSGSRTVLPRQQTLRAVVDWSWDLLDESERTAVRRLSVFSGGCTLPAAEHICADPDPAPAPDPSADPGAAVGTARGADGGSGQPGGRRAIGQAEVLGVLGSLVDKSILVADQPHTSATGETAECTDRDLDAGIRYRMLETIHEYAKERAAEHPADRAAAEHRHVAEVYRTVDTAAPRLRSGEQLTWLRRLEADLDNVRSALHRALEAGDREVVLGLVRGMGWFWWLRNYRDEGAEWVSAALDLLPAEPGERDATAEQHYRELQLLRYFLLTERQSEESLRSEHHLAVAREIVAHFGQGGPAAARFPGLLWPFTAFLLEGARGVGAHLDSAVDICRRYGGRWELAVVLLFRAHVSIDSPDGISVGTLPEIERLAHSTGDRWLIGQVCGLRAELATQHGRYEEARAEYEAALRYAEELGAQTELPFLLARIAEVWYREGDSNQAETLLRRAIADAERLSIADARTYGGFLSAIIALDNGETARARELHQQATQDMAAGTPPSVFKVAILAVEARITAAEQTRPEEAVRQARRALWLSHETGSPVLLVASTLLCSATAALAADAPITAVRLADAALASRGELPASVPEMRQDTQVRAEAGEDARAAAEAANRASGVPDLEQALTLLDDLLPEEPADD